jgi:hypothetical protein
MKLVELVEMEIETYCLSTNMMEIIVQLFKGLL